MNRRRRSVLASLVRPAVVGMVVAGLGCGLLPTGRAEGAGPDPVAYERDVRPLVGEFCLKCHSTEKHKGDLDLEQFRTVAEILKHPKIWQGVAEQLASGEMPPKDKPQPTAPQREQLLGAVNTLLDDLARARAGDPGPVVLRRLSNAEYTYTVRDLTGVPSLDPAREFPVDGAAGEGFMNVGNSLVMSPSLVTKYLDAGKDVAAHAVLLPDGLRFSPKATRRDWTEEILAEIREFYRGFTDTRGGDKVNLQGIVFETNEGGRLPLDKYLAAALELRDPAVPGAAGRTVASVATAHGLSARYLGRLTEALAGGAPSLLLDPLRARWRTLRPDGIPAFTADLQRWQQALWRFTSVGHIGKAGGPKAWMEPVTPLASRQEVRLKLNPAPGATNLTVWFVAGDAGDGGEQDEVVWQQPRLVAPGRADLLLRDVRAVTRDLQERRERLFVRAPRALAAAAEAAAAPEAPDLPKLARRHHLEPDLLAAWLEYLGIGGGGPVQVDSYFTNRISHASNLDFINGWGSPETPSLMANASDQAVRVPGNMKPHAVVVHPSPTLQAAIGWRSPIAGNVRVAATVTHAHPECGNGVTWALEVRRGPTRQRLAAGVSQGGKPVVVEPVASLPVRPGDLVSVLIGPRDGNHSCDLTAVDFTLTALGADGREWDLGKDVSPDVQAGNPHADRFGTAGVWHFYTEPDKGGGEIGPVIPPGSLLARWQSSTNAGERRALAQALPRLLTAKTPGTTNAADLKLRAQLTSLGGPLFRGYLREPRPVTAAAKPAKPARAGAGLDPARFGRQGRGPELEPASLGAHAPAVIEVTLPADLVAGCELVTTGLLHPAAGREGSVQLQVLTNAPPRAAGLVSAGTTHSEANGPWTSDNRRVSHAAPIVVNDGTAARRRVEAALDEFRSLFPAALCYTKIVPVDEVVTLTLFYREDDQLARLMLDDAQRARLDRLWDELHFVSHDALTLVDAFEQLWQFATQDADPKVFEPLREPIKQRAAEFRQRLVAAEPRHLDAVLEFADRAYRRPLAPAEQAELRALYRRFREEELPHDAAIRLLLTRVLVGPAFLYHAEEPGPGADPKPVGDHELAGRLSYFLWSAPPDAELRALAAQGRLHEPDVLAAQARRMLRDPRVRRLATEFACAWLHIYGFDELGEKSERHFPTFAGLRGPMYEESIRFFTDLFQSDRPVTGIVDADYTFLNPALAEHYGITDVAFTGTNDWRRVEGLRRFGRGGILGQATALAKQAGASRTSPILRGNWVSEVLLGEKLPRPPKGVPQLPEDEATEQLTVRQLTEKHSTDPRCAGCHVRIDALGFSLEAFDAIGRRRDRDLGNRPIDTRVKVLDGAEFEGADGLRGYLLTKRRDVFLRQFCRKLLGYSLGRAVQLSDAPLVTAMQAELKAHGDQVGTAVEAIVRSRQFREIRGRDVAFDE